MAADIAVLLPVHNARSELHETLESLRGQDESFVCFVVDDGSTPAISIAEKDYDFPIQLITLESNIGITAALNRGLEAIVQRGFRYIARIDAGDIALPGRFAAQKRFLENNPAYALVSTAYEVFDENGHKMYRVFPPKNHEQIYRSLFYRNPILHPGIMFNAAIFENGLRYDEKFRTGQDYEIIRRLSKTGKLANLPEILNRYQFSSSSITSSRKMRYVGRMRIQLMYFEPLSPHSYLGVLRSMLLCFVPFGFTHKIRSFVSHIRK